MNVIKCYATTRRLEDIMFSKYLFSANNHRHQIKRFDAVSHWIQQFPISVWVIYLVILGLLIIFFNALAWIAGLVPVGTFDLYRSSIPCYPIGSMMLIKYLNHVARQSFTTFRPVLAVSDSEYPYLEQQLTTMPRRGVVVTVFLSLVLVIVYLANTPYFLLLMQEFPHIAVIEAGFYGFAFAVMGIYFYHTLWQLWMVSRLHTMIAHVDLFNLHPLYAFSRLSSQTGISLLLMNFFGIVTDPATFTNIALINVMVIAFVLAVLSFVLPLLGIYRRITAEKRHLHQHINQQLGSLVQQMYIIDEPQRIDAMMPDAQLLGSLATTRRIVEDIPTLPLEKGTLINFVVIFALTFGVRMVIKLIVAVIV